MPDALAAQLEEHIGDRGCDDILLLLVTMRLPSDAPLEEIVRLAAAGADALPPHPAEAGAEAALVPPPSPPLAILTSRELEIAGLVGEGLSNRQIAERLVISKRTADAHIEHIYGKLGVSSRVQLAGWLKSSQP